MAVSLTPVSENKVAIIGLGDEGCRMVVALDVPQQWEIECRLWDSSVESLSGYEETASMKPEVLGVKITHGFGCGGQSDLGRSVFLQEQELCSDLIAGKELVILVSSLGGGFASGFAPELAKFCQTRGVPVISFCKMPFSFQGRKCMESAKQALNRLRENSIAAPTFESDDYLPWLDEAGLAHKAIEQGNLELQVAVMNLCFLLFEEGLYEFGFKTLLAVFDLDICKTIVFSVRGKDPAACVEQIKERLVEKFPNGEFRVDRSLVSIVGSKSLAVDDVNLVNKTLSDLVGKPEKSFFGACIDPGREDCTVVAYLNIHLGRQFELSDLAAAPTSEKATSSVRKKSPKRGKSKSKKAAEVTAPDDSQGFFDHILRESNRGYFENTPSNNWNGIDLDVPTYIRRGIRVKT